MLGYCTNVHSGDSFLDVLNNLNEYAAVVQRTLQKPLGVGLWLSDTASREVDRELLVDTLAELELEAFTLNGFPFSDFHQEVVKHKVYEPNWSTEARLDYTIRLAAILAGITNQEEAGISTLPLGWDNATFKNDDCVEKLNKCIDGLEEVEQQTSKCIHLDIETEPGCRLQRSQELCEFIHTYFGDDERVRRYIRVCYDTCHAAVMHECVQDCVRNYNNVGLSIGKVQLSSAIEFELGEHFKSSTTHMFAEPRYLHQASVRQGEDVQFFENYSEIPSSMNTGLCRVHFHVPIHLHSLGELQTTQQDLLASIAVLKEAGGGDWEVETYTWSVTPSDLQDDQLVDSITKEVEWASMQINQ